MSKTSSISEIIQQLDTLSLEQLLEVREKVNALIKGKTPESKLYETPRLMFGRAPIQYVYAEDETLDDAIKLVEEWMSDESGYDEETYPQIEAALNQNRLSL